MLSLIKPSFFLFPAFVFRLCVSTTRENELVGSFVLQHPTLYSTRLLAALWLALVSFNDDSFMLHELLLNFLCCFSIFKEVKNRFLISVLDLIMHSHFYFHYNDCPPVVISQKNRAESSEKTQRIMWKTTLWYPFRTETSIFFFHHSQLMLLLLFSLYILKSSSST